MEARRLMLFNAFYIAAFGELQVTSCICLRQVAGCFSGIRDGIPAPPLFIEEVAAKLTEEFVITVFKNSLPPSGY